MSDRSAYGPVGWTEADAALAAHKANDHGISPAQLRERVEALELSIGTAHNEAASDRAIMLSLEKRFEVAATALNSRLDAALKRIEELDNQLAQLISFDRLDEQALERKP